MCHTGKVSQNERPNKSSPALRSCFAEQKTSGNGTSSVSNWSPEVFFERQSSGSEMTPASSSTPVANLRECCFLWPRTGVLHGLCLDRDVSTFLLLNIADYVQYRMPFRCVSQLVSSETFHCILTVLLNKHDVQYRKSTGL